MKTILPRARVGEARRLVRVFLMMTVAAAVVATGRFAGSGDVDALLLPAWPAYFAAVVWSSDYEPT